MMGNISYGSYITACVGNLNANLRVLSFIMAEVYILVVNLESYFKLSFIIAKMVKLSPQLVPSTTVMVRRHCPLEPPGLVPRRSDPVLGWQDPEPSWLDSAHPSRGWRLGWRPWQRRRHWLGLLGPMLWRPNSVASGHVAVPAVVGHAPAVSGSGGRQRQQRVPEPTMAAGNGFRHATVLHVR